MRPPDVRIGPGYLDRWFVIPRNRWLNVYLHRFLRDDDDRALHDHPWASVSFLLRGDLIEVTADPYAETGERWRLVARFWPKFRRAKYAHRLVVPFGPAWTLFITGPRVRSWGFHCPQGWRHWRDFTTEDGHAVGRGCGE